MLSTMSLEQAPRGPESILVVEDSLQVRTLIHDVLEMRGYRVFEARTPREALDVANQAEAHFDLLVTDVVMPGMNGRELAEALTAQLPDLKVVFVSGYGPDELTQYGVKAGAGFLQKPFSPKVLASKVREILDSGAS
jgi:CheY-like chemotaxis protein